MEKENSQYNFHIDKTVHLFFIVTFFSFTSLFAYKYYSSEDCGVVQFKTEARSYRVDELIRFTDFSEGANVWSWDFDDSTSTRTERNPYHTFSKPGKYDVRLTINESCELMKTITIEEKAFVLDSTKLPVFKIPSQVMVGEKLFATDETKGANTWEWRFGETANVNSYDKKAEYEYREPGLKTISLVVNGDLKHIGKKKIKVLPKPKKNNTIGIVKSTKSNNNIKYQPDIGGKIKTSPDEDPKKEDVPYISGKQFGDKLVLISNKKTSAKTFQRYMCGKLNMSVVVNKKKVDFLVFCQKITGKTITVKNVEIIRSPGSNCIENVIIDLSKSIF